MTALSHPHPQSPRGLVTWTQNTAIFAVCANLFSTALANLGFVLFLLLFVCTCLTSQRRHLDSRNFPFGVAVAICIYISWQIIGLTYTDAPAHYAWSSIFSERKIVYILPLALLFSDELPKRRFLSAFYMTCAVGLLVSFALKMPLVQELAGAVASIKKPMPDNVFRSHATQSMAFAMCSFLGLWLVDQVKSRAWKVAIGVLSIAFLVNIIAVTPGRSGYVVFLVLLVWSFAMWRGGKGVVVGMAAAALLGVGAFLASPPVHDRIMKGVNEINNYASSAEETSMGLRMVLYKTTLAMIVERPLLGTGTGGFKTHFSAIAAEKYTGWRARPAEDPHNQYLLVTVENGLIGLAAFVFMLFMIMKASLKSGSIYGKMAAGCLLAWCATSLFSGHFRTFPEGHLIAFIVGMLMVSRAPDGQQAGATPADGAAG